MLLAPGIPTFDTGIPDLMSPVNTNSSLNKGLVSWWIVLPGLDGTKLWYDIAGSNHGTLTNMTNASTGGWSPTGRPGGRGSIRFDGTNDVVIVPNVSALKPTAAFTYSAWVSTTSLSTVQQALRGSDSLAGANYGFTLSFSGITAGKYLFGLKTSGENLLEATIPDTGWHHVTATYNGSTQVIYVDGLLAASQSASGSVSYDSGSLLIGKARSDTNSLPFSGRIDEVCIWSRALSAAEVKSLYDDSRVGYPQTLNWISPYYTPQQDAVEIPVPIPGDVYGLFGGGDFTGIQMGVPPEAIAAVGGYQGLLDFIGIPYGLPSQITPSAGNQAAARRRFYRHVVMHETYRSILDHSRMTEVAHLALVNRIANQWNEYQAQLARSREIAIFATLLSEV